MGACGHRRGRRRDAVLTVPHLAVAAYVVIVILVAQVIGVFALIVGSDDIGEKAAKSGGGDGDLPRSHRG